MGEEEPVMHLALGDGADFEATRENSSLFRFCGKLAIYDHVFFLRDAEEGRGMYVFSTHPVFDQLAEYMTENHYPAHLNLQEVADCDQQAYEDMIVRYVQDDLEAGIPEDWS